MWFQSSRIRGRGAVIVKCKPSSNFYAMLLKKWTVPTQPHPSNTGSQMTAPWRSGEITHINKARASQSRAPCGLTSSREYPCPVFPQHGSQNAPAPKTLQKPLPPNLLCHRERTREMNSRARFPNRTFRWWCPDDRAVWRMLTALRMPCTLLRLESLHTVAVWLYEADLRPAGLDLLFHSWA